MRAYKKDKGKGQLEDVVYKDKKITPEQTSLLGEHNFPQYPSAREPDASSSAKVGEIPELTKGKKEKNVMENKKGGGVITAVGGEGK